MGQTKSAALTPVIERLRSRYFTGHAAAIGGHVRCAPSPPAAVLPTRRKAPARAGLPAAERAPRRCGHDGHFSNGRSTHAA